MKSDFELSVALVFALTGALKDAVAAFGDRSTERDRRRDRGRAVVRDELVRSLLTLDESCFVSKFESDDVVGRFRAAARDRALVSLLKLFGEVSDAAVDSERRAELSEVLLAFSADRRFVDRLVGETVAAVERSGSLLGLRLSPTSRRRRRADS